MSRAEDDDPDALRIQPRQHPRIGRVEVEVHPRARVPVISELRRRPSRDLPSRIQPVGMRRDQRGQVGRIHQSRAGVALVVLGEAPVRPRSARQRQRSRQRDRYRREGVRRQVQRSQIHRDQRSGWIGEHWRRSLGIRVPELDPGDHVGVGLGRGRDHEEGQAGDLHRG